MHGKRKRVSRAVDATAALELLRPLADTLLVARPANLVMNSARNESPDCLLTPQLAA